MEIESSIKLFYLHNSRYPTEEEGLRVLMIPPEDNKAIWKGPYIEKPYTDRWNKPYVYTTSVVIDNESFKVYSFGENGIDEKCKGEHLIISD